MPGIEEFALSAIASVVGNIITKGLHLNALPYLTAKKVKLNIEEAAANVVESFLSYFRSEKVTDHQQKLLIQDCCSALQPFADDPAKLFHGSLNGQKIFEDLYAQSPFPQATRDEGLENVYALLFPRVATFVCRIAASAKEWESEKWVESFQRFDQIVAELKALFEKLDDSAARDIQATDATMARARRALKQKVAFNLDLTGLRSEKPLSGNFDDLFVHPGILEQMPEEARKKKGREPVSIETIGSASGMFLSPRRYAVVTGAPGAGKSTWTEALQREALSSNCQGLPIRIVLRQLDMDALPSLYALIRKDLPHLAEEATYDRIRSWLESGLLAFIIDGFDEISVDRRDEVRAWILDMKTSVGDSPIVITSRPLTTDQLNSLPKEWKQWNIQPFDEDRITDYISRWYAHAPLLEGSSRDANAKELSSKWRSDPAVGPLTGNPLLLSTLLTVNHLDGSLPNGRSELYKRYVDGMLGLWDDRRKVSTGSVPLIPKQRRILQSLALYLQFEKKEQMDEDEANRLVGDALKEIGLDLDSNKVLECLRERSGLLIGPGTYSLVHKSVGEFLVAEAVVQGDRKSADGERIDRFQLFEHRKDDRWNMIVFFWAGLAPVADVESFVDQCNEARDPEWGYGIFNDQFDRFTRVKKRQWLLGLAKYEDGLFGKAYSLVYNYCGPKELEQENSVPSTFLSGLYLMFSLPTAGLSVLLGKSIEEEIVKWKEVSQSDGPMKDLWWICFLWYARNTDEWKQCLSHNPQRGSALSWRYSIAFSITSDEQSMRLSERVEAFSKALPGHRDLLPLAFLSTFFPGETDQMDLWGWVLQAVTTFKEIEISEERLLETKEWCIDDMHGRFEGDLLIQFHTSLPKWREKGILTDENLYQELLQYVEALIDRRDKFEAETLARPSEK